MPKKLFPQHEQVTWNDSSFVFISTTNIIPTTMVRHIFLSVQSLIWGIHYILNTHTSALVVFTQRATKQMSIMWRSKWKRREKASTHKQNGRNWCLKNILSYSCGLSFINWDNKFTPFYALLMGHPFYLCHTELTKNASVPIIN